MRKKLSAVVFALLMFGAGCAAPAVTPDPTAKKTAPLATSWNNIAAGIDRYECPAQICGVGLIMFRFAKDRFVWRFENRAQPSTVEAWAASLPKAVFVANGVYFDEKFQPTGLLKTAGTLTNGRTYDADKSGLLELAPQVAIIDTATAKPALETMTEAGQNFPLLIKNGGPVTTFKDEHASRRTFVGVDREENVYVGTVAEDAIDFSDLAALLAKTDVKWDNVINLDGGTSTGFSVRAGGYEETLNSIVQVPNVIIAERK